MAPIVKHFSVSTLLYAVGWVLLVAGVVWYVHTATSATVNCIYRGLAQSNESTMERSDAAERRDNALVRSKLTMGRVVELRIGDRSTDSGRLHELWSVYLPEGLPDYNNLSALSLDYVQSVIDYVTAQHELDETRADNPVPNVRRMCAR